MAGRIMSETVTVTTTGAAGSATGNASTAALNGLLLDITLDYHATAPATTDLTVSYVAPNSGNLLVVTDSATDAVIAPRQKMVDNANAAITNSFAHFPLDGPINFALAQCNALAPALTAKVRYVRSY